MQFCTLQSLIASTVPEACTTSHFRQCFGPEADLHQAVLSSNRAMLTECYLCSYWWHLKALTGGVEAVSDEQHHRPQCLAGPGSLRCIPCWDQVSVILCLFPPLRLSSIIKCDAVVGKALFPGFTTTKPGK